MKQYFLYYLPLACLATIATGLVLPIWWNVFAMIVIVYNIPLLEILGEVFDIRYNTDEITAIVDGE